MHLHGPGAMGLVVTAAMPHATQKQSFGFDRGWTLMLTGAIMGQSKAKAYLDGLCADMHLAICVRGHVRLGRCSLRVVQAHAQPLHIHPTVCYDLPHCRFQAPQSLYLPLLLQRSHRKLTTHLRMHPRPGCKAVDIIQQNPLRTVLRK
jgi:hypothetical protein